MRILIADDSAVIRSAVSALLSRAGHEVIVAEDGVEAIQRFYQYRPDLLLLDIQMPKVSGYLVCRLIKEDWAVANVPVLMVTSRDTAEDRYWAEKSGADGYLIKDNLSDSLLAAVRAADASRALTALSAQEASGEAIDQVDVLSRVVSLLDRKLFETTVVNDLVTVAAQATDLRSTIRQALAILRRFVDYQIAGVAIPAERLLVVRTDRPATASEVERFRDLTVGQLHLQGPGLVPPDDMHILFTEPNSSTPDGGGSEWHSFFAVALRSRGEVLGLLALAATRPAAFTPQVARTLRLVEYPMAAMIESAYENQRALAQEARLSLAALAGDSHGA